MKHFLILIAFLCFSKIHSQQVINIGSTIEEVKKVMGEPTSVKDYGTYGGIVWSYGNSGEATITFKNNKVSEYNNYGGILKIGDIEEDKKRQKELKEKSKRLKEILGHDSNDTLNKKKTTLSNTTNGSLTGITGMNQNSVIDYDTYLDGKYKEVAKAENWSNSFVPTNADQKLKNYNSEKLKQRLLIGGIVVLIFGVGIFFIRRKKQLYD